jgi:thioester reductase-like protein
MANSYFVTGATGAIGSALLPLLLAETDSKIWALIRADNSEHLSKRLEELIEFWELDQTQAQDARARIIALQGDTDQNQFALPDDVYSEITRQCTHIIHCAGVVRMNLSLETARQHALGAAKNVVELAHACHKHGTLQKIEFVSTVGVAGKMPGLVPETWITQPREFHNTYEQSKAEAEDYLREQIQQHGLPVTVHRPSMVVGDSKTGKIIHYQIFYHICEFLAGRRTFGLLPFLGDACVDTVPVDYVANVIKLSAHRSDCIGKIFHLCSGPTEAIKLRVLRKMAKEIMEQQGFKLPAIVSVPTPIFNAAIKLISPLLSKNMQRAIKSFPFFLDYLADKQGFSNSVTGLTFNYWPPNYNDYLTAPLDEYLRKRPT